MSWMFGNSHKVRTKRGKDRYYPTGSFRRHFKKHGKAAGWSKKKIRKETTASWW